MRLDDRQVLALLRQLDDPEYMEFPRDFDLEVMQARFDLLVNRLGARFQCACAVDRDVQDASFHGRIVVPKSASRSREDLTLTISNFGSLAAVTLGNPGTYGEEEEREFFDPADRDRIDGELEALGFVPVAEHLLWSRYDGVTDLVGGYPAGGCPTWWVRFFDYL